MAVDERCGSVVFAEQAAVDVVKPIPGDESVPTGRARETLQGGGRGGGGGQRENRSQPDASPWSLSPFCVRLLEPAGSLAAIYGFWSISLIDDLVKKNKPMLLISVLIRLTRNI